MRLRYDPSASSGEDADVASKTLALHVSAVGVGGAGENCNVGFSGLCGVDVATVVKTHLTVGAPPIGNEVDGVATGV